jgi:hypothetical protein
MDLDDFAEGRFHLELVYLARTQRRAGADLGCWDSRPPALFAMTSGTAPLFRQSTQPCRLVWRWGSRGQESAQSPHGLLQVVSQKRAVHSRYLQEGRQYFGSRQGLHELHPWCCVCPVSVGDEC